MTLEPQITELEFKVDQDITLNALSEILVDEKELFKIVEVQIHSSQTLFFWTVRANGFDYKNKALVDGVNTTLLIRLANPGKEALVVNLKIRGTLA